MNAESGTSTAEKQRLRAAIADQVRRYVASGGSITVLKAPGERVRPCRSSGWQAKHDFLAIPE